MTEETTAQGKTWVQVIHYGVVVLLLVGGLGYWMTRPPTANPLVDEKAAAAMALVQTHRALGAPTVRQAINDHVTMMQGRGVGIRLGEWRVERQSESKYVVRIELREEESGRWFEREYSWHVDVARGSIRPISLTAKGVMPLDFEMPTLLNPPDRTP
jgi:hypothetical protein